MENKVRALFTETWSPHVARSLTLAESPFGARNPPCLLIMPGLLRSDRGGLSVSSPSGEQKDACSLRKWCVQASCLEVLLVSRVNQATQPLFSTEFSYWAILILLLFISLMNIWISRWCRLPFKNPGSAGAGPRHKVYHGEDV